jgi:ribosomal protein S18 acetylase RimI-like enzyme
VTYMIQLRRYSTEDCEAVRDLWVRAGLALRPSDTKEELEKKLGRDPELFLVAEENGAILGAVIGAFDGRRGFIYHLAVAPERQGEGIGKALTERVSEGLKKLGCIRLLLLVDEDNLSAQEFYKEIGFSSNRMYVMSKDLDQ